ncbi:putative flavonol 7-O-beta-glucosyltransferase [Medicago truncatula]|uniref:Glycosyltransferase n=1 Tax=Medicago truncatula TaxID=3880 RepID=A0A072U4G4_MEDTR|nr:UDP-glycosyltransferase 73C3 [Medicago truncatula]KEH24634.1 UDP-glucosyltransferase family protein [Medicago truncatula]RHN49548.1 putative flavonol 7-O-beta-glucosyltransferase [Medicago truncatula]
MVLPANINDVPHFVLFPLIAQGHIIPMIDIAKLLAQRGVIVTIFTTPKNASRFTSVLSRAVSSGLQIKIVTLNFPTKQAGLPEGCENFDMVDSIDMRMNLFHAITLLQKPAEELFDALTPKPSCIISDFFIPWTIQIAENHKIPRISFHGFSCFCLHCMLKIQTSKILERVDSESEYFTVPGIPDQIQVTKEQIPGILKGELKEFGEKMHDAEMKSYGEIINTFEELEKAYVKDYKKEKNGKVWFVGPVSLCNKDGLDKAQRGIIASISEHHCLKWLDLHQPKSVVYACLGSLCNLIPSQLMELALALEATNRPFIWVIREGNKSSEELEKWISEERNKGRGLIIRGWAPQVLILSHPSIGGFLTHCGWNSTLEGISAGLPLVTWPLFADQFLNEKLVTQVLRIGVSLGVEVPMRLGVEESLGVLVKKEGIKEAICMVMDEGEESKERRERASKLSEMAKRAVEKGGSSHLNINLLIQDIMEQ